MAWAKLDDKMPRHPKMLSVTVVARWLYVAGLCYSQEHLTDGVLPQSIARVLYEEPEAAEKAVEELVGVGLWERCPAGFHVHDFLDWNPSKRQVMAARKAKARAGTMGGKAKARARQVLKQNASKPLAISDSDSHPHSDSDSDSDSRSPLESSEDAAPGKPTRSRKRCTDGFAAFRDHAWDTWEQAEGDAPPWAAPEFKQLQGAWKKLGADMDKARCYWGNYLADPDPFYAGHPPKLFLCNPARWQRKARTKADTVTAANLAVLAKVRNANT